MKKKMVTVMLAALLAASAVTGCGKKDSKAAAAKTETTAAAKPETKAETTAPETKEETKEEAAAEGEMVSDEVFAVLQDDFSLLVEAHDAVAELYNSEEIAANPEIESVMNQAYDVITQMGEITQEEITQEDAEELIGAMEDILDALSAVIDGMELTDEAAGSEVVSDETFAALQQKYERLTDIYNTAAEAYNNGAEENADIKNAMDQAYDVIEEMGQVTQDSITEAKAEEFISAMDILIDALEKVADAL